MSEINGVARVLVVLLLAGLMALFVTLAIDLAIPTPKSPWETSVEVQIPPAKQASLDASRSAVEAKLANNEITQAQADEQLSALVDEESALSSASDVSPGVDADYTKAMADRSLIVSLAGMAVVALLLTAGVILTQRGIALAGVPLFAGAMLGFFTAAMGAASDTAWIRIVISGAVAVGAASAGLAAFVRPAADA